MRTLNFILFMLLSSYGFSQDNSGPQKEKSKMEVFSEKSGTLMKKDVTDIGKIGKKGEVKVQRMIFTDMLNSTSTNGIRLEYDAYSSLVTDTKVAFIDKDEIDGLIKSLKLMKESVLTTTPANYTEVIFKSRSGFEAGCFNDKKNKWNLYLKLERYDSKSSVYLPAEEMDNVISVLESGKATL